jgi:hypothetical protein
VARRLTPRQTAVLAAVERHGAATVPDLRDDFPGLAPSTVARVLGVLVERGLVRRSGDPALVYLGGVEFHPVRREEGDDELAALVADLVDGGELHAWADHDARMVVALLPLTEVRDRLLGLAGVWDRLDRAIARFFAEGRIAWVGVGTELSVHAGEPGLQVQLGLDGPF